MLAPIHFVSFKHSSYIWPFHYLTANIYFNSAPVLLFALRVDYSAVCVRPNSVSRVSLIFRLLCLLPGRYITFKGCVFALLLANAFCPSIGVVSREILPLRQVESTFIKMFVNHETDDSSNQLLVEIGYGYMCRFNRFPCVVPFYSSWTKKRYCKGRRTTAMPKI